MQETEYDNNDMTLELATFFPLYIKLFLNTLHVSQNVTWSCKDI